MSQELNGHVYTTDAGEALEAFRFVRLDASGNAVYCDAGEDFVGRTRTNVASGDPIGIKLPGEQGTWKCVAAGAITLLATVYTANDGKISATASGTPVGRALQAASGNGSVIEVMPFHATNTAADSLVTTVLAGETIPINRLLKFHTDGTWLLADAGNQAIAVSLAAAANGAAVTARMLNGVSQFVGVASETIEAGDTLFTAADGKVADTASATQVGIARNAAAADAAVTVFYQPALAGA